MKVYVLHFYDNSGIVGVFKTEEAAETAAIKLKGFGLLIEEYEVQE